MDDLYALDGGAGATHWQKRHAKRKLREAKLKLRKQVREEAKADLRKRTVKWRAAIATAKAAGIQPPSKHCRPRDVPRQWIDMTGWRFGRLRVIRVAPVSKNGKQRCRRWWVKCDCGSGEHLVNGTNLRQGLAKSCGCLKKISGQRRVQGRVQMIARVLALPLSQQLLQLKKRIVSVRGFRELDNRILIAARKVIREAERSAERRRKPGAETIH